eukprot:Filipodium_phascolosomae@DN853_c0_g1_i1.p1
MDVGLGLPRSALNRIILLVYMLFQTFIFLLPQFVGTPIAKAFSRLLGAPLGSAHVTSLMHYPYYYWVKMLLLAYVFHSKQEREFVSSLRKWVPQCPLLFLYSGISPMEFFDSIHWVQSVTKNGGRVLRVQGSHWMMMDPRSKELVEEEAQTWLNKQ